MTTLTFGKKTITLDSISSSLLQHTQCCQNVEECGRSSGEGLFVKGGQDRGIGKGKALNFGNKMRFKSKDRKTTECYGCRQIGHWKRDC